MVLDRANAAIGAAIVGAILAVMLVFKFISMSNEIEELKTTVAVKTVQVVNANANTERANKNVELLAVINDNLSEQYKEREEFLVSELSRTKQATDIIHKNEVDKLVHDKFIQKANGRMVKIAKRKPAMLEKIINNSNKELFAEIETLTTLGE